MVWGLSLVGFIVRNRGRSIVVLGDCIIPVPLPSGQYYDHEMGLAYNRFRYYSPELGRYISEDPILFASGTLALHNYVEDSNSKLDVLGLTYKSKKQARMLILASRYSQG